LSFVESYESADGSVVGFFDLWRKVAGGQFFVCPVISYALTAFTLEVAWVRAWAVCYICL